eukprot:39778-Rhodomonas_salina.1
MSVGRYALLVCVLISLSAPAEAATRALSRLVSGNMAPAHLLQQPKTEFSSRREIEQSVTSTIEEKLGRAGNLNLKADSPLSSLSREHPRTLHRSVSFSSGHYRSQDLATIFTRARALRYVQRELDPRLL